MLSVAIRLGSEITRALAALSDKLKNASSSLA